MALGTVVLSGVFVAPAVLVGTLVAARKGEQRLTQAHDFVAQVDVAIEEMRLRVAGFEAVTHRMNELQDVIDQLDTRLTQQVQRCEHFEHRGQTEGAYEDMFTRLVFQAYTTCVNLTQVLRVPVVDEHFQVTAASDVTLQGARARLENPA